MEFPHALPTRHSDILLDPATLIVLAMLAGLALWESLVPGRPLPRVRGWLPSTLLTLFAFLMTSAYLPLLWADALAPLFQHANLRTPVWLGYFIQRPESHSVHHQRDLHRYNYADLPVIDMLFGTFQNPREHAPETGFWHGASNRVVAMLLARDVSRQSR